MTRGRVPTWPSGGNNALRAGALVAVAVPAGGEPVEFVAGVAPGVGGGVLDHSQEQQHAKGRHFRTLDGIVLDTSDDMAGELIFTVFAAIAKFQRQQIVKGTREGLDAARARGRVGGRPRALSPEQIADARILLRAGQTQAAVAGKLGVSRWTLKRALDPVPN